MFRTDLLPIIRSLNTVFTAIGICHTSYVDCLLMRSGWKRYFSIIIHRYMSGPNILMFNTSALDSIGPCDGPLPFEDAGPPLPGPGFTFSLSWVPDVPVSCRVARPATDRVPSKGLSHLGLPRPLLSSPTAVVSNTPETKDADLLCQHLKIL